MMAKRICERAVMDALAWYQLKKATSTSHKLTSPVLPQLLVSVGVAPALAVALPGHPLGSTIPLWQIVAPFGSIPQPRA
jgi:hypothetical protein